MTTDSKIKISSNRSFGLVFFVVFLIVTWGEPIVNTPENAFNCFMGTEIDILVISNCLLRKEKQNTSLKIDYKHKYELD